MRVFIVRSLGVLNYANVVSLLCLAQTVTSCVFLLTDSDFVYSNIKIKHLCLFSFRNSCCPDNYLDLTAKLFPVPPWSRLTEVAFFCYPLSSLNLITILDNISFAWNKPHTLYWLCPDLRSERVQVDYTMGWYSSYKKELSVGVGQP